jgi:hypothetical protein
VLPLPQVNKATLILLLLLVGNFSWAQQSKFIPTDSIKGKFSQFSVDNFGRVYLCENDIISQYYSQNDTVYTASLKSFRPTSIESSKSFRTMVFDQDRSVLHFYDNTLTDIHGEIDLVATGIQQPLLVCESFAGNTFWVLDGGMMRLVKLNRDLEIVSQTENLVSLFDNDEPPSQMIEHNDFLYVLIPGKGVAIFDVFGTFIKIYPSQAINIGALNNYLLLQTATTIEAVPNNSFLMADFTYAIPQGVIKFAFSNSKVYFLKKHGLVIGKFK